MRVLFTAMIMMYSLRVVTGSGSCTICEEGTFCFDEILQNCPANSTSPAGSFNLQNCSCNPGYYGEGSCDFCGIGFYCTGGSSRSVCPQHKTTTTKYSSDLEDCECIQGYSPDAGSACVGCPVGKYKDLMGMHSCTSCPENKYSDVFASISSSDCEDCPQFSVSVQASDHITDCICIPGFFRETANQCGPCPLGTFGESENCVDCPVGTYNSYSNATSCLACQPNSNTNTNGSMSSAACICLAGYVRHSQSGVDECVACGIGYYENNGVCVPSPRNKYVDVMGSFSPTDCPPNSTTTGEASTSIDDCLCGIGFEKSNAECIQCAVGKFKNNSGSSNCQLCASGFFAAELQSRACTPCAQNTFQSQSGMSHCDACTPNSLSVSGADDISMCRCDVGFAVIDGACVECGLGFYKASVANEACDQCSPGFSTQERQAIASTACGSCLSNQYSFLNETDFICRSCPDFSSSGAGSYNVTQCMCRPGFGLSDKECSECITGKYKDVFGNTDCVSCPDGMQGTPEPYRRTSVSASCVDCESGTYEDNNICVSCHSNSTSAPKSIAVTDCICEAGFKYDDVKCTACGTGKFKNNESNADNCNLCPVGTYNHLSAQSECIACPENMTTLSPGQQDISSCECNFFLGFVINGLSCKLCAGGSYVLDESCAKCSADEYYPIQKPPFLVDRCRNCPDNMYSIEGTFGVDGCVCPVGFLRNTSTSCKPCAVNFYCPSQYQQTPCPSHSESSGGVYSQEQCHCAAGYFGTATTECVLCDVDSYCTGGATRTACKANSTTLGLRGQSNENACVCDPGFFEDTDLSCTRCLVDSYCFNDSITHCPLNSSAFSRSDSITDCRCSFGLYMENSTCHECDASVLCLGGQSDPISCSVGALVENGRCVCENGRYCDTDDLQNGCLMPDTCAVCPVGSRCENNVRTPCHANSSTPSGSDLSVECVCLDGWYLDQGQCKDCPNHHYCTMDEKAYCLDWDTNLRTIDGYHYERTHCECEVGYFRLNYNDTCKICPKNFYCPTESTQQLPNIVNCFENEYTVGEGSHKRGDCICDAGSKLVADGQTVKCLPCSEGERCVNGIVQEEFCHVGFRVANSDHSACVCISGFEEGPSKNCRPCAMGYVKAIIGNQQCIACAAGSFSINSTTCSPCASDRDSVEGSSECLCKAPLVEIEQECRLCEVGFYYQGTPGNATCVACLDFGTSIPRVDEIQQECFCIPGYYMSTRNGCLPCGNDTFWEDGGCVPCGVHSHSPAGSISRDNCSCQACTSLNWNGVHECFASCAHETQNCSACPAGKFKDQPSTEGNTDRCQHCALHRYSVADGSSSCSFCPPTRMTTDVGAVSPDLCICRPGFTQLSATSVENCSMCDLGHYKQVEGNEVCDLCRDGSFADAAGMTACKNCSIHSEIQHAIKTFEHYGAKNVSRCTCAWGYFLDGDASNQANQSIPGSSGVCSPCVSGSFKHAKGFQQCDFCGDQKQPYDFHFTNTYGKDEVAAISTSHCVKCPDNSGQDPAQIPNPFVMDEIQDCLCVPGYERISQNITMGCRECEIYKFKLGYSNQNCSFCGENEFYHNKYSNCTQCELKVYDSVETHSFAVNRVYEDIAWGVDQADCVCDVGYYRDDLESTARCHPCSVGYYRNDIMNDPRQFCLECPVNKYSDDTATVFCKDCPPNSFTYYNGSNDVDDCRCSAGFEWSDADSTCNACPPGKFQAFDDTESVRHTCQICADGTFSDDNASISCQFCGANMHSTLPRDGEERCECDPGFGGPSSCAACEIAFYSGGGTSDDQYKACQACPAGKTTFSNTSKYIEQCACLPGYGISPYQTTFKVLSTTESLSDGSGNQRLKLENDDVLVFPLNVPVVVDISGQSSAHPFTVSTTQYDPTNAPGQEVLRVVTTASTITYTLLQTTTPLYYLCGFPTHNFEGVLIPQETNPSPTHTCSLCQDGYYAAGFTNVACTHCGLFGVTEPEIGATHFDACMCNHEIGVFETEFLL